MNKDIVVEGCELELKTGKGTIQISTPASSNVKADSKGVYYGPITISVAKYTGGTIDVKDSGYGTAILTGSASKTKINNLGVVLEGDNCSIVLNGMKQTDKGPVPAPPFTDVITIKKAGQTIAKGK